MNLCNQVGSGFLGVSAHGFIMAENFRYVLLYAICRSLFRNPLLVLSGVLCGVWDI